MDKFFIHYSGTVAAFKSAGLENTYRNGIVFISGDAAGKGAAIYTHNKYYANIVEALDALTYFSSISDGKTTATATGPNGTIIFSGDDNSTVSVQAGSTGVKIGLSDSMLTTIDNKAEASVVNGINSRLQAVEGDYLKSADKTALQNNIDKKVDQTAYNTKMQELADADADNLKAAKDYADAEIAKLNAAAVAEQVETNKSNIATLVGSDTNMSARAIVQDEVAKQLTSENITESFDTLKEMAEYLSGHPQDVTEMNQAIQAADAKGAQGIADAATAQSAADQALQDAAAAQQSADAVAEAVGKMDLAKVEGFITSVEQADGKVTATAVQTIAAEKITVADSGNKIEATNVEAAIAELAAMWEWEEL